MVDECDSMAETKQLGVDPSSSTTLSPSSSSGKSSEESSDNEAMLLQQIHHIKTPKPEYKSSEKENFVWDIHAGIRNIGASNNQWFIRVNLANTDFFGHKT